MHWPFLKRSTMPPIAVSPAPEDTPGPKTSQTYGVYYHGHNIPHRIPVNTIIGAWACLENCGERTWQLYHPEGKRVDLIIRCDGMVFATHLMPRPEVHPGERVTIYFPLHLPCDSGVHELQLELVEQNVTFFTDQGVEPLKVTLLVEPAPVSRSAALYEQAAQIAPWYYQPTRGVGHSGDGRRFPLFISKAKGCYLWDLEGQQYIDYIMGWGCALLGYAEDRVQKAIREVLDSAAVVPFPHPLEIDVAHMLTEDIPCAEMVVFGKNGSDVCTVAARLARAFTGKRTILYSGYHGWQDFWAEQAGFATTGIPERPERLIHHFKFNTLSDFMRLYQQYRDDLAAVMLEPSGPGESIQGPVQDADREFLAALAQATQDAGALLIYDEIMTGYRYPSGSVQRATGVIPDLTCLGKALSAGMPLSALVGRAHIFQRSMHNTHYGPTFRGEIYSFAAAKAAIQIYRSEPVAEYVWDYGTRLKQGVNRLCQQLGIAAACVGPPFRMALAFNEPDAERLRLKRTLYQQELLKAGVITYGGVMLPSYSHGDHVLKSTFEAVGLGLERVGVAEREDTFHRALEIPLL
jgi:glutamate-1-semialdehyde 2,1-aminomutase